MYGGKKFNLILRLTASVLYLFQHKRDWYDTNCSFFFSFHDTTKHSTTSRNYFLIIGLTVLIGLSCLLHVHFYTLYQHHRKKVKDIVTGQQKKEALQSLLQQANNELSSEYDDSELDDMWRWCYVMIIILYYFSIQYNYYWGI